MNNKERFLEEDGCLFYAIVTSLGLWQKETREVGTSMLLTRLKA